MSDHDSISSVRLARLLRSNFRWRGRSNRAYWQGPTTPLGPRQAHSSRETDHLYSSSNAGQCSKLEELSEPASSSKVKGKLDNEKDARSGDQ